MNKIISSHKEPSSQISKSFVRFLSVKSKNFVALLDTIKDESKLKVVKIFHCETFEYAENLFERSDFWEFLVKFFNCFVIVIEIEENDRTGMDYMKKFNRNCKLVNRPLLIQFIFKNSSSTYLKTGEYSKLLNLEKMNTSNDDLIVKRPINLETIIQLRWNNEDDLVMCEFEISKRFQGLRLIDLAVQVNDDFAIQFLSLFDGYSIDEKTVETTAKYGTKVTICALLNLSTTRNSDEFDLDESQRQIINFHMKNHRSFLSLIAEHGSAESLQFLLKLGSDITSLDANHNSASDFSVVNQKFKNLLVLLENDAPFPKRFNELYESFKNQIDSLTLLKQIIDSRLRFFEAIKFGYMDQIQSFIATYPSLKITYCLANETALSAALKYEQFDVYAYLLQKRFNDDQHEAIRRALGHNQKYLISMAIQKYFFRPIDSHILFLYTKSRLAFSDPEAEESQLTFIKELYENLDKHPEISPILKVAEHSKTLSVTFDFNNAAVNFVDFTAGNRTLGICYFLQGRLYIGAGQKQTDVEGTLAHELSHYAIQIMFENECFPFDACDYKSSRKFQKIMQEYQTKPNNIKLVKSVFDCYDESSWMAELIVIVPHMVALGLREELIKNYPKLYDFYMTEIIPKAEELTRDPVQYQNRLNVQQFNNRLGYVEELLLEIPVSKLKAQFSVANLRTKTPKIFISESPKLLLKNLLQTIQSEISLNEIKSSFIFAELKSFSNAENLKDMINFAEYATLIVNCEDIIESVVDELEYSKKLIIVCKNLESSKTVQKVLKRIQFQETEICYCWCDLIKESQKKVLLAKVSFQGFKLYLNELINEKSSEKLHLPVVETLNDSIEIGCAIQVNIGYIADCFIERTYEVVVKKNLKIFGPRNFFNFLSFAKFHRMIVLWNEAGMGKSTALTHIALQIKSQQPDCWVLKFNLQDHIEVLRTSKEDMMNSSVQDFLIKNFVKPKNEFEAKLFKSLYFLRKVVILMDGFDEICPDFKVNCLVLIKKLQSSLILQIWVTTRPYVKTDLEKRFNFVSVQMREFTLLDQVEFLKSFWMKDFDFELVRCQDETKKKLEKTAQKIIWKISQSFQCTKLTGIPLISQMVAEVFGEDVKKSLLDCNSTFNFPVSFDIYSLYESFVKRKIQIAKDEKIQHFSCNNINEFHEKAALKLTLKRTFSDEKETKMLPTFGMVSNFDRSPTFTHQSFADFFTASALIKELKNDISNFIEIVVCEHGHHDGILSFINSAIRQDLPHFLSDMELHHKVANDLCLFFKRDPSNIFLHRLIMNQKNFLVIFLLRCMQFCRKNNIRKMLMQFNENQFTVFHLSVKKRIKFLFEEVYYLMRTVFSRNDIDNMFLKTEYFGRNVIELAFELPFLSESDYCEETLKIRELQQIVLINSVISKRETTYHDFYMENSMLNLVKSLVSKLPETEQSRLAFENMTCSYSFWPNISPDQYQFFIKHFKSSIDLRWKISHQFGQVTNGNLLFESINVFLVFLENCLKIRSHQDTHILAVLKWILQKFHLGSTFKSFIFKNFSSVFDNIICDDSALNVLRLIKSNISEENFSLLISSNIKSFTSYPHIGVESIWRIALQIFGSRQIKILLVINNETNLSFFHMVIRNKRKSLLKTILEAIKRLFSDNEIFSILKLMHKDDLDLMDFAMMHFEMEIFKMLADFLIENVIEEENLSQLISQQAVRLCVMEQNKGAMVELLNFLNTIRFGLFREFLLVIDENDRINSFIYYLLNENPTANWAQQDVKEAINSLFFYSKIKVFKYEMKKLKFKRNCQGKMKPIMDMKKLSEYETVYIENFLKLLPSVFNINSTDDSFEWIMYLGIFPRNVFIAQLNESGNFVSFTQFKIRNSSVVKIFLKNEKVEEIFKNTSPKNFIHIQRFLELVKFDSDLDDDFFAPIMEEYEIKL